MLEFKFSKVRSYLFVSVDTMIKKVVAVLELKDSLVIIPQTKINYGR